MLPLSIAKQRKGKAKVLPCCWTLSDAEIYFGQSHSPHFPSAPQKKAARRILPAPGGYEGEQRREREKVVGRSKLSQFLLSTKKMAEGEEEEERPRPHSPSPLPPSPPPSLSA